MFNAAQGPAALNSFLILVLSTRVLSKRKKYKKQIKMKKNEEKNLVLRDIIRVNLNISEGQPKSISLELKRQPMFT